jgi:chemotaxis protein MotB
MKPHYLGGGAGSRPSENRPSENRQTDNRQPDNRWMVSYLDVLTILLVFFIAVAARALQPAADVPATPQQVTASASLPAAPLPALQVPPAPPTSPATPPASTSLDAAQEQLTQEGFDLHREQWGLVISLPQAVLFPSGDERIQSTAVPLVDQIAAVLRAIPNQINLAGNSDSVPIHNRRFHNNWELSAARGMALLDSLASHYGIDEARLSVTSYGSFRPRDSNDTPSGRAGNRRVEITILDQPR